MYLAQLEIEFFGKPELELRYAPNNLSSDKGFLAWLELELGLFKGPLSQFRNAQTWLGSFTALIKRYKARLVKIDF